MKVLFVCTGNVCRSPMAEAFLVQEASSRGLDLSVRSTGTHAWAGRAATIDGRRTMAELGTPMDDHRTRVLDAELVGWADLILTLATEHTREVVRDFPDAAERTFLLKELVAVLPHLGPWDDDEAWIRSAHERRGEADLPEDLDVHDPFGEREEAYRRVAAEIRDLIGQLAEGLEKAKASA